MGTLDQNASQWLEGNLIPDLKLLYCKPNNCEVKYNISIPGNSFFVSMLFFLDLQFLNDQQNYENTIHVVVKRPPSEKNISGYVNLEKLFHNEILFYTKCLKMYSFISPKLMMKPREDSTIVMENLSSKGYRLSNIKVNVSNKLMFAIVRELARFHATGYVFKYKKPGEFFQIVKEAHTHEQMHPENIAPFINCTISRIFHYLRKEKYDSVFREKLETYLQNPYGVLVELIKPVEPFATLCHGDFTINNILYKEDNDNIIIKFIDFSMISYSSPFIDFAVFLLLSGSRELIREKFTEIFEAYCDTLLQNLKEHGILDAEIFSKKRLLEDFKRHMMFGYIIACVFRPTLIGYYGSSLKYSMNFTFEQTCKHYSSLGGDEMTKNLVEMLLDLKEIGCLDHIINN